MGHGKQGNSAVWLRLQSLLEPRSPKVALAAWSLIYRPGLELAVIPLPLPLNCWNYRCGVCAVSARGIRWFHDILNFYDGES